MSHINKISRVIFLSVHLPLITITTRSSSQATQSGSGWAMGMMTPAVATTGTGLQGWQRRVAAACGGGGDRNKMRKCSKPLVAAAELVVVVAVRLAGVVGVVALLWILRPVSSRLAAITKLAASSSTWAAVAAAPATSLSGLPALY